MGVTVWRRVVTVLAICSMCFVQAAMAAQACVAGSLERADSVAMPEADAAPCAQAAAGQAAAGQVNRCQQHCDTAQLSIDQPPPVFAAPALAAVYSIQLLDRRTDRAPGAPYASGMLSRATSPPAAIRNCCFRT
jgi:hypothetical protein